MSAVTHILARLDSGDASASDQLLPLVYDELRKLAAAKLAGEKPGQTLQATALVHEAYLRLVGGIARANTPNGLNGEPERSDAIWNSRGHFFAAAAEAMRRILVDNARKKQAEKRGGPRRQVALTEAAVPEALPPLEMLALNEALEELRREHPIHAQIVNLRFFGGLTLEDTAASLGISLATVKRHWTFSRAWLFGRLDAGLDKMPGN